MKFKLERHGVSIKLALHDIEMFSLIALMSRTAVILTSLLAVKYIGVRHVAGWSINVPLVNIFVRWDSAYYLTIAQEGYVQESLYAFRPLYPLLLRSLATIFCSINWETMAVTGFIANNILFFISTLFLYKLTETIFTKDEAYRTVILFSFLPGTVYLSAVYPETLYLTLLFSSFYCLQKSKVFTAAFLSLLAALARPEGAFLSIVFLVKALQNISVSGWRLRASKSSLSYFLAAMFPIVGTVLFGVYVGNIMQPFFSELMWDKWTLSKFISLWWLTEPDGPPAILSYTVLVLIAFSIFVSLNLFKKANLRCYHIWSILLTILFLVAADFRSLPRLALQLFPLYWTLATLPRWQNLLAIFVPLSLYGTILYACWYPIL